MENDANQKKKILLLVVTVLTALAVGYYFYSDINERRQTADENVPAEAGGDNATTSLEVFEGGKENEVALPPAPSLDRPIVYPADMPSQIKLDNQEKISKIINSLKSDPGLFNDWIDLGLYRKILEDYEGARQAWEYASLLRPQSSASFGNLGILYGYYLKDAPKAEKNFLKAIENDAKNINLYFQTYEFYRDVMKDLIKAKAIIETGLKNNPADQDLANMLKELTM